MSDAQDIVTRLVESANTSVFDPDACAEAAAHIGTLRAINAAILSKCERMEKVVEAARAMRAVEESYGCGFYGQRGWNKALNERDAALDAIDAVHADGNAGGGVIQMEDKPDA